MKDINILGIDLSTNNCSIALLNNGHIEEISLISETIRSQQLLSMINKLLINNQMDPYKLTALAFGAGPGSFTGLKIASSVLQGLKLAWQKPIIKISSLWALALQGYEQLINSTITIMPKYIMPCADAKMGQVYYGLYNLKFDLTKNSKFLTLIQEDCLADPKNIKINNAVLVVGDGVNILRQKGLFNKDLIVTIDPIIQYVQATSIVKLAEYNIRYTNNIVDSDADPIYLKLYD